MDYHLLRRTRSTSDGIVHLRDPIKLQLSICAGKFSASQLDMAVRWEDAPTCLFCIAGMTAGLRYYDFADERGARRYAPGWGDEST